MNRRKPLEHDRYLAACGLAALPVQIASRPTVEAVVSRCVRSVAFRQIAPRHSGAQHIKYCVHDLSMVCACALSSLRHQRLQKSSFLIAQIKSHDSPPTTVSHVRPCFSIIYVGTDPSPMSAFGTDPLFAAMYRNVGNRGILLQKSFCTGDQKFCGLQARLSCKDVRDLIASR